MKSSNKRFIPQPLVLCIAALALSAGCEYDSPFTEDSSPENAEAGMNTFYKDTGGDNQDPTLGGGQAPRRKEGQADGRSRQACADD